MDKFDLDDDDKIAIEAAMKIAWLLVRSDKITPDQLISLGRVIQAIENMPEPTSEFACTYGISYELGGEPYPNTNYIEIRVDDISFCFWKGFILGGPIENEHHTQKWEIELSGWKKREIDVSRFDQIVESAADYLTEDAEIMVVDEM